MAQKIEGANDPRKSLLLWVEDDPFSMRHFIDETKALGFDVEVFLNPDEMWKWVHSHDEDANRVVGFILDSMIPPGDSINFQQSNGGKNTGVILAGHIRTFPKFHTRKIVIFTIRTEHDIEALLNDEKIHVLRKHEIDLVDFLQFIKEEFPL